MVNRNDGKILRTNNIINLTNETFCLYNDFSGEIIKFPPSKKVLNVPRRKGFSKVSNSKNQVIYVVTPKELREIKSIEPRRTLKDIAVLTDINIERDGAKLAYLIWAKKPSYIVRFAQA